LGDFSALRQFDEKYISNPKFCWHFIPLQKVCINFDKKCVGLHFGRFLSKLIRSPWRSTKRELKFLYLQAGRASLVNRVTRLGEFSPIGWHWVYFLKITKICSPLVWTIR
jgi:hypothetical protein